MLGRGEEGGGILINSISFPFELGNASINSDSGGGSDSSSLDDWLGSEHDFLTFWGWVAFGVRKAGFTTSMRSSNDDLDGVEPSDVEPSSRSYRKHVRI